MSHTIYIVEDHAVTRMGMVQLFDSEPTLSVCGEASSAPAALGEIEQLQPDLVVVDLSLEDSSGLELIKQISERWAHIPVLVISTHEEMVYAERVLQAGARGYVMKRESPGLLIEAVQTVLKGRRYLSAPVTDMLIGRVVGGGAPSSPDELGALTDREMEVFELLGRGFTRSAIAEKLSLSPKTVDTYRERLKEKLGAPTTAKLVQRATLWLQESV